MFWRKKHGDNKNKQNKGGGFTLIELLVVVAIIGILISIFAISMNSARARARDVQRVHDMESFRIALALYHLRHDGYPVKTGEAEIINDMSGTFSTAIKSESIMGTVPADPGGGDDYHYFYLSDGTSYIITYCLETNVILGKTAGCGHQLTGN